MATIRSFIAVALGPEMKRALTGLQQSLQEKPSKGLKWTTPDGLHFTMAFLGQVPE